ncbi:hypothetical protein AGMMS50239_35490 [Bacteroidia bacterium]|nr:hypothetical protein AGMMS50239_35490 [Bacteroidia bacterium]
MANKSLIFYGKPQSFERYEISGNKIAQDEKNEPRLKPTINNDILHYFFKDGFYYLELYGYANPYRATRPGVVIGVCIKSDEQIAVSENNVSTLKSLLVQFKDIALAGTYFNALKLTDISAFRTTIYNVKTVERISTFETSNSAKPTCQNLTLLYLKDFENKTESLQNEICNYGDIYIAADKDLFYDDLNRIVFNEVQQKFYVVQNGKIEVFEEPKVIHGKPMLPKPLPNTEQPETVITKTTKNEKEFVSKEDFEKFKKRIRIFKRTKKWTSSMIMIVIAIIIFFLGRYSTLGDWKATFFIGKNTGKTAYRLSIDPKKENLTVEVDSSITLKATIMPDNSGFDWDTKAEWSIDRNTVATLTTTSQTGKFGKEATIKGKDEGIVTITLKVDSVSDPIIKKITITKSMKPETSQQPTTHIVMKGETFFIIKEKYNMTNQRLIDLNPTITNLNDLREGQTINIEPQK